MNLSERKKRKERLLSDYFLKVIWSCYVRQTNE